ncbi:pyridoxal phosphate-dependent transferase [Mycotypha africana]|uniref:pyridoxal phosphate-dependent transferase n=1 Tax=Mycotypha africana TaxID=64632 RepID=UPI0023009D03|nr:pyridoxal phosphate-dependent transferase [Mycotypha africana]KAI8970339.1 pyridoxal phosphate-dependent transferase [Mycotypha africana]
MTLSKGDEPIPKFGRAYRKDFSLESSYIPVNHGSFGTFPHVVKEQLRKYQDECELQPDRWYRYEKELHLKRNLDCISRLIHCDAKDLAFVQNSSQAANTVLRSYPFKKGDKIICLQTAYVNVEKTLLYIRDKYGVQLLPIELNYPLEDEEVVQKIREVIEAEHAKIGEPKIIMGVIDAICSAPGVRLPFESIASLLKQHNILSLIDGAHVLGQIEIDIEALDPDFFFTNCHKWLYTPRGCTILYVAKRNQGYIHPTTINFAYEHHKDGAITSTFNLELSPPTIDCSNYLCVETALKYRESIGGEEKIRQYTHDIAVKGGQLVAEMLGTRVMENSTKTLTASMVNVELPHFETSKIQNGQVAPYIIKKLVYEHNMTALIYENNGKYWIRLSGQIYVDLNDFKAVGEALLSIIQELNK